MQLVTVSIGFFMSVVGFEFDVKRYAFLLVGTLFCSGGACTFNHYIESEDDLKMNRTKKRPLPSGQLSKKQVFIFAIVLTLVGIVIQYVLVNINTAFIAMLTISLYLFLYTPLKKISWLNTFVGAIPGALPILGGWVANNTSLSFLTWSLFFVLFCWQHPHFYALAVLYKKDYELGQFKMLPIIEPDLTRTTRQTLIYTALLFFSSIVPFFLQALTIFYLVSITILFIMMAYYALLFSIKKDDHSARLLFFSSIIYLPMWFLTILVDLLIQLIVK
tara:strand:- start:93 stop:917 length:825 start_codon:yes stop_codon:yes gene_type:complete